MKTYSKRKIYPGIVIIVVGYANQIEWFNCNICLLYLKDLLFLVNSKSIAFFWGGFNSVFGDSYCT